MSFPVKDGDFNHSSVSVYQRVIYPLKVPTNDDRAAAALPTPLREPLRREVVERRRLAVGGREKGRNPKTGNDMGISWEMI